MLRPLKKIWWSSSIKARMFSFSQQDYEVSELAILESFYEPSRGFFNRKEEMSNLAALLKREDKRIFILTGPPNCGKTRLAKETLKDLNQFIPITYNMRSMKTNSSKNDTLIYQLAKSFNRHLTLIQHLKNGYLGANSNKETYFGFNVKASIPLIGSFKSYLRRVPRLNPLEISGAEFNEIFEKAIENYHQFIFMPFKINLVLFIDEFNNVKDEKDQNFVKSLLHFLIKKSKEEDKLSVLLATADSFLVNYLNNNHNLNSGAYEELYVGWLSKEEVFRYLEMRKVPKRFHDMIYEFHGGNILELKFLLSGQDETINEAQILRYKQTRLRLDLPKISAANELFDSDKKHALLEIYKKLLKQDFVIRSQLDNEFGENTIVELLRRNLLYSQRGDSLKEGDRAINAEVVTLNAPSHKFAVAEYLNELGLLTTS